MKVYNYDSNGYIIGVSELDESDKCQITGNWLIPGMATEKEPPIEKEGFEIKFIENDWIYEKIVTDIDKKIQGLIPLEEGEYISEGELVKSRPIGDNYSWDFSKREWYLDELKVYDKSLPNSLEIEEAEKEIWFYEMFIKAT